VASVLGDPFGRISKVVEIQIKRADFADDSCPPSDSGPSIATMITGRATSAIAGAAVLDFQCGVFSQKPERNS